MRALLAGLLVIGCGGSGSPGTDAAADDDAAAAADATPAADAPPAAGGRRFAIEVNEPPGIDHGTALAGAMAAGSSAVQLTMSWAQLEPIDGQRDLSFLAFGMDYYADRGVGVLLSIPTIDTVSRLVPADLAALPMDDPAVIARFESLLDDVLAVCGDELLYLVIGNEVDVYLGSRPSDEWVDFETFIDAGMARVRASRPALPLGVSVTFGGIPDPRITDLVDDVDVLYMTYYFIGNEFGGQPAEDVPADLQGMVEFAGDLPVVIKEWGYPTGPATGGTEAGQDDFIAASFTAWDQHAASNPFFTFSRMYDGQRTDCEETAAAYGFPGDEAFIQFLCTLGLRRADDTAKPAWATLVQAAAARGF